MATSASVPRTSLPARSFCWIFSKKETHTPLLKLWRKGRVCGRRAEHRGPQGCGDSSSLVCGVLVLSSRGPASDSGCCFASLRAYSVPRKVLGRPLSGITELTPTRESRTRPAFRTGPWGGVCRVHLPVGRASARRACPPPRVTTNHHANSSCFSSQFIVVHTRNRAAASIISGPLFQKAQRKTKLSGHCHST